MLAEQALRKLAAAAKAGALKADAKRRNEQALSGPGKARGVPKRPTNEDIFADLLKEIDPREGDDQDEGEKTRADGLKSSEGMMVNSDTAYWRGGKRQGLAF